MTQSFIKSISKSAKAAVVAALALVFWAAGAFFVRAQDKGTEAREQAIRVFYRFDSAVLDRSYLDNPSVFAKLDSLMRSVNPEDVQDLQVISYSSPEGVWEYNVGLSERRARAFAKYIQDTYPSFRGKVSIHPDGESWDDLKASIEADTRLSESERTRALRIINFEAAPDAKERALKNLPTYSYLYSGYFRRLRYAEIKLVTPAGIAAAEAGMRSASDSAEEAMAGASGVVSSLEPVPGRVYFRLKDTSVDPSYLENTATLSYIRQLLANTPADEISSIVIFSSTSPDGAAELNDKVESERAKATEEYITARYPELAGKIEVRKSGENWTELRSLVEADDELSESSKQKILSVIDSSATPDEKEQALRELDEYEHLAEKEFPMLRYSRIEVSKSEYDTKSKGHGNFESQDDKSSAAAAASGSDRNASDASGKRGGLDPEPGRLYFRKDKTDVDRDYLDNEGALAYIDSLLSSVNPDEVESIEIRTSASPDGTVSHNDKVEARRAESVRRYIESKYPEFSDKVKETRGGENWPEFRKNVEDDDEMSEPLRKRILSIIDSDDSADRKEQRLRDMDEYDEVAERHFPALRYAETRITRRQKEEPKAPEAPEIPAEDIETEEVELNVEQDTLDTFVAPVDTLAAPVEEPVDTIAPRRPVVALSTNVLYDLAITPNFAIEVPVGKKVSVYGEYTFPWWVTRDNSRAWQILKWDIGARYWFFGGRSENPMDVMIGPFAGIDLSAGYYDIEPHHKGWQGEFQMVGAELGWAWDLGRNWRLDAYVGAGWMGSHFRYYEATTGDKHLIYQHSGKLNWFGPTKAGVSVKYIFGTKDRRTVK